jgi:hypothetical protein
MPIESLAAFKRLFRVDMVFRCEHHLRPDLSGVRTVTEVQANGIWYTPRDGIHAYRHCWVQFPERAHVRFDGETATFLTETGTPAFTYHFDQEPSNPTMSEQPTPMSNQPLWTPAGSTCVDTGMILITDPAYVIRDSPPDNAYEPFQSWDAFTEATIDGAGSQELVNQHGAAVGVVVATTSDGEYPVYVQRDAAGAIIAALIRFDNADPNTGESLDK